MERFNLTISVAILMIFAFVALLFVLPRVDRALTIRSIEICSKISQFTKDDTTQNYKASYPIADLYQKCLDKTK